MYSIMSYFGKVFLFILFGFYLFWGDEGFRKTNWDIPATAQKARLKELRRASELSSETGSSSNRLTELLIWLYLFMELELASAHVCSVYSMY